MSPSAEDAESTVGDPEMVEFPTRIFSLARAGDILALSRYVDAGGPANSPGGEMAASRRLVALLLQSLRAHPADSPAPLPLAAARSERRQVLAP